MCPYCDLRNIKIAHALPQKVSLALIPPGNPGPVDFGA